MSVENLEISSGDIAEKEITLKQKTLVSLLFAVASISICIGGYKKILDDNEKMIINIIKLDTKIDDVKNDLNKVSSSLSETKGRLDIVCQYGVNRH